MASRADTHTMNAQYSRTSHSLLYSKMGTGVRFDALLGGKGGQRGWGGWGTVWRLVASASSSKLTSAQPALPPNSPSSDEEQRTAHPGRSPAR